MFRQRQHFCQLTQLGCEILLHHSHTIAFVQQSLPRGWAGVPTGFLDLTRQLKVESTRSAESTRCGVAASTRSAESIQFGAAGLTHSAVSTLCVSLGSIHSGALSVDNGRQLRAAATVSSQHAPRSKQQRGRLWRRRVFHRSSGSCHWSGAKKSACWDASIAFTGARGAR